MASTATQILILIGPPDGLTQRVLDAVRAALELAGMVPGTPRWLSPAEACELSLGARGGRGAEDAARLAVAGWPVDVAVVPATGRRKRLLVADMESTIIENEMLVEMAEVSGLGPTMAEWTARTMAGELDFDQSLKDRVALFSGQAATLLDRAAHRIRPTAGAGTLVATMRAAGALTALVSGGFTVFAEPVGATLGFDRVAANRLLVSGGRLTGLVAEPILGRNAKLEILSRLAAEAGLAVTDALAVGDGANDIPMLTAAGLGVAFHPKPIAAAAAGARIFHRDLTALLFLQGYARAEFVPPRPA